MKNLVNQIKDKQCKSCKWHEKDSQGKYQCRVVHMDEDIKAYWKTYDTDWKCYGYNNDDMWYL